MIALKPELVHLEKALDGASNPTRFDAVNKGWVSISRPWRGLTESTGVGNPKEATREKGERYLALIVPRLAQYIVELSKADVNDAKFPF
jgi:creatinine amidohydrolase